MREARTDRQKQVHAQERQGPQGKPALVKSEGLGTFEMEGGKGASQ